MPDLLDDPREEHERRSNLDGVEPDLVEYAMRMEAAPSQLLHRYSNGILPPPTANMTLLKIERIKGETRGSLE